MSPRRCSRAGVPSQPDGWLYFPSLIQRCAAGRTSLRPVGDAVRRGDTVTSLAAWQPTFTAPYTTPVTLTGEFTLRSGEVANESFDKYLFESDPALLRRVAEAMVTLLAGCDVLGGMEMGGIPIVAVMSQLTGLPAVFVRKAPKEYGTGKAAEGSQSPVSGSWP